MNRRTRKGSKQRTKPSEALVAVHENANLVSQFSDNPEEANR